MKWKTEHGKKMKIEPFTMIVEMISVAIMMILSWWAWWLRRWFMMGRGRGKRWFSDGDCCEEDDEGAEMMIGEDDDGNDCEDDALLMMLLMGFTMEEGEWWCWDLWWSVRSGGDKGAPWVLCGVERFVLVMPTDVSRRRRKVNRVFRWRWCRDGVEEV